MSQETTIWIIIVAYMLLIFGIGVVSSKSSKNITDFTVGGRNAGAWVSALSYGTAYFSAVMFIGYAGGTGWNYGLWGVLVGIGNALFGSLLAWMVLANRTREITRRLKIKSMPQFFEKKFGSSSMKLFSVAIIFIFLLPYSASVYKGLTSVCSVLLKVDEQTTMIVIAIASAAIVTLGGYAATLKADFIQGILMLGGVSALIVLVVRSEQVGGLVTGLETITAKTSELALTPTNYITLVATILMTSFGTWGLPQMIHKYYGIRDDKEVKRGTVISTVFALVVAGGGYFIGSLSRLFYSSLDELPDIGAGKTDYLIPNVLLSANLPVIIIGLVLVLLIAASVSTLSSITITASSTLTMDLITSRLFPTMDKRTAAIVTKVLCLLFVVLSYFIANSDTPILDMMSYSWGVISGAFLAPYLLSLYWKQINKAGAWAGMLTGFLVALPPLVCKLFFPDVAIPLLGKLVDLGSVFACLAMISSFAITMLVSLLATKLKLKSSELNLEFYKSDAVTTQ